MARWSAFGFALALGAIEICAAAELPRSDTDESFEVEPPLLIPNRDLEKPPVANEEATPAPIVDSEKLEKDLARAKRSATGADRLFKIGVISKADAEQRVLRVARLESDLENARLALASATLAQEETRVAAGEIAKADLAEAEAQLSRAMEAAHTAAAKRERAELDFAESNLHRQQKLLALGTGRKADVARAEQKLAELKAPKSN